MSGSIAKIAKDELLPVNIDIKLYTRIAKITEDMINDSSIEVVSVAKQYIVKANNINTVPAIKVWEFLNAKLLLFSEKTQSIPINVMNKYIIR